jgi:hypothetical protein
VRTSVLMGDVAMETAAALRCAAVRGEVRRLGRGAAPAKASIFCASALGRVVELQPARCWTVSQSPEPPLGT